MIVSRVHTDRLLKHLGVVGDRLLGPLARGHEVDKLGNDAVGVVLVIHAADDRAVPAVEHVSEHVLAPGHTDSLTG